MEMRAYTEHIIIGTNRDRAFEYIADYRNIPVWSKNFILKLEATDNGYIATTPMGQSRFEIAADPTTGTIDLIMDGRPIPTRVIALGPDVTLFLFTLIMPANLPDNELQQGLAGLREELALLKQQLEQ